MNSRYSNDDDHDYGRLAKKWIPRVALGASFAAFGIFVAARYRVAGPAEYIVRTGLGIPDVAINKHAVQWPFQTYRRLNMAPTTFAVDVDAMSKERIPFKMPSVWTVGPQDNPEYLKRYSRFLIDKDPSHLRETVEGIIQGEARISAANLNLDELFLDRGTYKNTVTENINAVIETFGLRVYNSNISELADLDDKNQYFTEQKKRALQKVIQEARIHVAEARKVGETGEKMNEVQTRQQVAQFEKDAILVENQRQMEIAASKKERVVAEAGYKKEQDVATAEAKAISEQRTWELQQRVEFARSQQEIEKRRATELSAASVDAEIQIRRAEGEATSTKLKADAQLYAQQKEAEGIQTLTTAQAKGLQELLKSAGNTDSLVKYLLVSTHQLEKLAREQGNALRDLKPNVNIWNTGPQTEGAGKVLTDLFKTGIPLFSGIKQQTGYDFFKTLGVNKSKSSDNANQTDKDDQDSLGVGITRPRKLK